MKSFTLQIDRNLFRRFWATLKAGEPLWPQHTGLQKKHANLERSKPLDPYDIKLAFGFWNT
ncbi:MAG TPA: hypothetical protein VLX68_02695 [Chitinivibrionales bacterium]|nr:hypothetical protein [Chitinivibrionales bacterium]